MRPVPGSRCIHSHYTKDRLHICAVPPHSGSACVPNLDRARASAEMKKQRAMCNAGRRFYLRQLSGPFVAAPQVSLLFLPGTCLKCEMHIMYDVLPPLCVSAARYIHPESANALLRKCQLRRNIERCI